MMRKPNELQGARKRFPRSVAYPLQALGERYGGSMAAKIPSLRGTAVWIPTEEAQGFGGVLDLSDREEPQRGENDLEVAIGG